MVGFAPGRGSPAKVSKFYVAPHPANPTFTVGYTTTPTAGAGNSYTANFNFANGPYTMPQDGILKSCSFFLTGSVSGTAQLGVYGSTGGLPGALLAVTSPFSAVTGWQTVATTTNPTIAAGTVIWMGAVDTVSNPTLRDANVGFTLYSGASGVSTLQNPFGTATNQGNSFQLGAYATFTPAPPVAIPAALTGNVSIRCRTRAAAASPPIYYVDGSVGSDSNNGLSPGAGNAWATIAHVNAQTWLSPGTQVLFAGGQTFSGTLTPHNGLTTANPLVFGSYGTGNATIAGGSGAGFLAQNMGGITVQDLIFTGTSTLTNTGHGIQFDNNQAGNTTLTGISVLRCTVSGFGLNGIFVSGSTGTSGFTNVLIDGCTVHDCTGNYNGGNGSSGIYVASAPGYGLLLNGRASHYNVTVQNCVAYNHTGKAGATNWVGSGITVTQSNNVLIQLCTAHDNGANGNFASGGPVGIWVADATNCTIQFCESYSNKTGSTADGDGFDLDGGLQNAVIQYCYSHDNVGAGYQLYTYDDSTILQDTNKVIRFCISQNDSTSIGGCIALGNDSTRAQSSDIYNNTVFASAGRGLLALGGAHISTNTGHIANNIFYSTSNVPLIVNFENDGNPSSLVLVGNDYYNTGSFSIRWNSTTYTTFAAWQTATSQEKVGGVNVGLTSNPQLSAPGTGGTVGGYQPALLSAYAPASGSPVVGGGQNLSSLYAINVGSQDFYGNAALLHGSSVGADSGVFSASLAALLGRTALALRARIASPLRSALFSRISLKLVKSLLGAFPPRRISLTGAMSIGIRGQAPLSTIATGEAITRRLTRDGFQLFYAPQVALSARARMALKFVPLLCQLIGNIATLTTGDGGHSLGWLIGTSITLPAAGNISSISIQVLNGATGNIWLALYSTTVTPILNDLGVANGTDELGLVNSVDTLGTVPQLFGQPGTIIAQTAITTAVNGWQILPVISNAFVPAGSYWLCVITDNNTIQFAELPTGVSWAFNGGYNYTTPPNPVPTNITGLFAGTYAIYANFSLANSVALVAQAIANTVWARASPTGLQHLFAQALLTLRSRAIEGVGFGVQPLFAASLLAIKSRSVPIGKVPIIGAAATKLRSSGIFTVAAGGLVLVARTIWTLRAKAGAYGTLTLSGAVRASSHGTLTIVGTAQALIGRALTTLRGRFFPFTSAGGPNELLLQDNFPLLTQAGLPIYLQTVFFAPLAASAVLIHTAKIAGSTGKAAISGARAALVQSSLSGVAGTITIRAIGRLALRSAAGASIVLRAMLAMTARARAVSTSILPLRAFGRSGLQSIPGASFAAHVVGRSILASRALAAASGVVGIAGAARSMARGIASVFAVTFGFISGRASLMSSATSAVRGATSLAGRTSILTRIVPGIAYPLRMAAVTSLMLIKRFAGPSGTLPMSASAAIRATMRALPGFVGQVAIYGVMAMKAAAQFGPTIGTLSIPGASARIKTSASSAIRGATSLAGQTILAIKTTAASRWSAALASSIRLLTNAQGRALPLILMFGRGMLAARLRAGSTASLSLSGASRLFKSIKLAPVVGASISGHIAMAVRDFRTGIGLGIQIFTSAGTKFTSALRAVPQVTAAISAMTRSAVQARASAVGSVAVSAQTIMKGAAGAPSRVVLTLSQTITITGRARAAIQNAAPILGRLMSAAAIRAGVRGATRISARTALRKTANAAFSSSLAFASRTIIASQASGVAIGQLSIAAASQLTAWINNRLGTSFPTFSANMFLATRGPSGRLTSLEGSRIVALEGRVDPIVKLRGRIP